MVTYLGSLVQLCCGEGGTQQTNITGVCGECSQCMDHSGSAAAPGCSARALSKAGPAFHVLPRSELLRFRFSGTPQEHRLGWVCVLCPSLVRAAQATGCLVSALSQVGRAS